MMLFAVAIPKLPEGKICLICDLLLENAAGLML